MLVVSGWLFSCLRRRPVAIGVSPPLPTLPEAAGLTERLPVATTSVADVYANRRRPWVGLPARAGSVEKVVNAWMAPECVDSSRFNKQATVLRLTRNVR